MLHNTTKKDEEFDSLEKVMKFFDDIFLPKLNLTYERYKFMTVCQRRGQSYEEYFLELKELANTCEFKTLKDGLIRDKIVCGILDKTLTERLLQEPKLTAAKAMEICKAKALAKIRVKDMGDCDECGKDVDVDWVKKERRPRFNFHYQCGKRHAQGQCPLDCGWNQTPQKNSEHYVNQENKGDMRDWKYSKRDNRNYGKEYNQYHVSQDKFVSSCRISKWDENSSEKVCAQPKILSLSAECEVEDKKHLICKFDRQGCCRFGKACWYKHLDDTITTRLDEAMDGKLHKLEDTIAIRLDDVVEGKLHKLEDKITDLENEMMAQKEIFHSGFSQLRRNIEEFMIKEDFPVLSFGDENEEADSEEKEEYEGFMISDFPVLSLDDENEEADSEEKERDEERDLLNEENTEKATARIEKD